MRSMMEGAAVVRVASPSDPAARSGFGEASFEELGALAPSTASRSPSPVLRGRILLERGSHHGSD
jgi:hypothetical protein